MAAHPGLLGTLQGVGGRAVLEELSFLAMDPKPPPLPYPRDQATAGMKSCPTAPSKELLPHLPPPVTEEKDPSSLKQRLPGLGAGLAGSKNGARVWEWGRHGTQGWPRGTRGLRAGARARGVRDCAKPGSPQGPHLGMVTPVCIHWSRLLVTPASHTPSLHAF